VSSAVVVTLFAVVNASGGTSVSDVFGSDGTGIASLVETAVTAVIDAVASRVVTDPAVGDTPSTCAVMPSAKVAVCPVVVCELSIVDVSAFASWVVGAVALVEAVVTSMSTTDVIAVELADASVASSVVVVVATPVVVSDVVVVRFPISVRDVTGSTVTGVTSLTETTATAVIDAIASREVRVPAVGETPSTCAVIPSAKVAVCPVVVRELSIVDVSPVAFCVSGAVATAVAVLTSRSTAGTVGLAVVPCRVGSLVDDVIAPPSAIARPVAEV
jgi:hypothetical protein